MSIAPTLRAAPTTPAWGHAHPGSVDDVILTGTPRSTRPFVVARASTLADLTSYRRLRRDVFVAEQGMFVGSDADDADDDPRTIVLLARSVDGEILGGVRLHPVAETATGQRVDRDLGWWRGSRLVVRPDARSHRGIGPALVRAACATAESAGALRFDATVQQTHERLFHRLGWTTRRPVPLHDHPHVEMDWAIGRIERLVRSTKAALGGLLAELTDGAEAPYGGGGAGFVGDDGSPVPGTDVIAACDAILPSMVERDPEWAGWCAVLVNLNDLHAMGAVPTGLLDAVGARDASFATRILRGLVDASRAFGVPVLGGHTQLGVPASLSVTALGRTTAPVRGGGARPGQRLRVSADLGGGWRPGYTGSQWDSSTSRSPEQLRSLAQVVPALHPTAAKDVSMSGLVGTTGMLAEASGCRAVLDIGHIPSPEAAGLGDWLTCFPGFAVVSAEDAAPAHRAALPRHVTSAVCGELTPGEGVGLRWPDGVVTDAVHSTVTGLGAA